MYFLQFEPADRLEVQQIFGEEGWPGPDRHYGVSRVYVVVEILGFEPGAFDVVNHYARISWLVWEIGRWVRGREGKGGKGGGRTKFAVWRYPFQLYGREVHA